ncbi:hypothetical protein COU61_04330, partial [Candidatus Pacearchaeota archaeon CG10_big_fil_rev_8_21_14_0_10_35_13]
MMKLSIIITAFNEEKTIGRAIDSFLCQKELKNYDYEIIGVAPDAPTLNVIKSYSKNNRRVKFLKDPHKGKPSALNLVFKKAKGEILILTDGDVHVTNNSIKELLKPFSDKSIGAVAGHPLSSSPKNTLLGYWSHVLTGVAHKLRLKSLKDKSFIHCTGYLYAIRAGIVNNIPVNALVDDGFISHKIFSEGFKIGYAQHAEVFVKYPDNFADWVMQKKRSAGGYNQLKDFGIDVKSHKGRGFFWEALGSLRIIRYATSLKELYWSILLLFSRLYLWVVIFR